LTKPVASAFGRVLRRLRLEANLSQEELGLEAGLQRNYISSLELGEKHPSITSIFKLASALQIKPSKLIALVEAELN
jgi:transcriptional regulator with XRE-family HTH domain